MPRTVLGNRYQKMRPYYFCNVISTSMMALAANKFRKKFSITERAKSLNIFFVI